MTSKNFTPSNHTVTITANEDFVIIGDILYNVVGEREIPGLGKGFDIRNPEGRVDWISAEFFPRMVQGELFPLPEDQHLQDSQQQ